MAIRVDTSGDIIFGIMSAQVTVTHARFRRASDDGQPVVYALPASVVANANEGLRIRSGMFDLVYKAGPFGNTHMRAVIESYWGAAGSRTAMEVDLMTSSTVVVADSGYSQQSYSAWAITEEND